MPTTLSTFDASIGEIKLRYQEPYTSEGLNASKAVVVPRGTHRGFRLATNPSALTLTFVADPVWLDHVAQYLTSDANDPLGYGHTLTIRRTGGNFTATLAPSTTFIIAIYATYAIGNPTTAVVNAYSLSEYLALAAALQSELIVLGTVVTPGSGVIPPANISHKLRVFAGNQIGQDAIPFQRLLDDPAFSQVGVISPTVFNLVGGSTWFFNDGATGANATFIQSDAQNPGANTLNVNLPSPATVSYEFDSVGPAMTVQAGQIIGVTLSYKILSSPSGGTFVLSPVYLDITGSPVATPDPVAIDYTVTNTGAFKTLGAQFAVPAGAVYVTKIEILATSLVYAGSGDVFRVQSFQAWFETLGTANGGDGGMRPARMTMPNLRMTENQKAPASDDPTFVSYNIGQKFVALQRSDGLFDSTHIPPGLVVQSTLRAGSGLLDTTGGTPAVNKARILTDAVTGAGSDTYTLLWSTPNVATQFCVYARGFGTDLAMVITYGASWDQSTQHWTGSYGSYRLYIGALGVKLQRGPVSYGVAPQTFTDPEWIEIASFNGNFTDGASGTPPYYPNSGFGIPAALLYFQQLIDTATNAAKARLSVQTTNVGSVPRRTLLLESGNYALGSPPNSRHLRIYMIETSGGSVGFEVVQGAYWDPTGVQWIKDGSSGDQVQRFVLDGGDLSWGVNATSGGSFADSVFTQWSVGSAGTLKAFGYVIYDNDGAFAPYGSVYGYNVNILSSSVLPTDTTFTLHFFPNLVPTFGAGGSYSQSPVYIIEGAGYQHGVAIGTWKFLGTPTSTSVMTMGLYDTLSSVPVYVNTTNGSILRRYSTNTDLAIVFTVSAFGS